MLAFDMAPWAQPRSNHIVCIYAPHEMTNSFCFLSIICLPARGPRPGKFLRSAGQHWASGAPGVSPVFAWPWRLGDLEPDLVHVCLPTPSHICTQSSIHSHQRIQPPLASSATSFGTHMPRSSESCHHRCTNSIPLSLFASWPTCIKYRNLGSSGGGGRV